VSWARRGLLGLAGVAALLLAGLPFALGHIADSPFIRHWWQRAAARGLLTHLVLCLLAAATWYLLHAAGERAPRWGLREAALGSLIAVSLASCFGSVYLRGSLAEVQRVLDYALCYWLVTALAADPGRRTILIGGLLLGGALTGAQGVQQWLDTLARTGSASWRVFGPFFNPNAFANYLLVVAPLALVAAAARRGPERLALRFAVVLILVALFLTGSKGGLASFAIGCAVLVLAAIDPARPGARRLRWLLIGAGAALFAAALLAPPIRVRLAAAFGSQSHSAMFRVFTWQGTWHMALARPVLGFGAGTFELAYPRFAIAGPTDLAHETYLQLAAETGFIGLAALLAVIVTQGRALGRLLRAADPTQRLVVAAALAGLVAFCLHNLVDYGWHASGVGLALWALLGIGGAAPAAVSGTVEPRPEPSPAVAPQRRARTGGRRTDRGEAQTATGQGVPIVARWAWVGVAVLLALGSAAIPFLVAESAAWQAEVAAGQGAIWEAETEYARAAQLDPLNGSYARGQAQVAEWEVRPGDSGALAAAEVAWERVGRLQPTALRVPLALADVCRRAGRPEAAMRLARRATQLAPHWTEPWVALAEASEAAGDRAEAVAAWHRVADLWGSPLQRYPALDVALDVSYARAWLALAAGADPAQALELHQRATQWLIQVAAGRLSLEAAQRVAGEYREQEWYELATVAERAAVPLARGGPLAMRMRGALLLAAVDRPQRAEQLFVAPLQGRERSWVKAAVEGWAAHSRSAHLNAEAQLQYARKTRAGDAEGERLADASEASAAEARRLLEPVFSDPELRRRLSSGPGAWSAAEMERVQIVVRSKPRRSGAADGA